MNDQVKGNLSMFVSKVFSGLNENSLRFLLPKWMSPNSGVFLRLGFGAVAFWIIGLFSKQSATPTTLKQRFWLFMLGAVFMFGYMYALQLGLTYTTPVSSAIFICLEPVWVFILCMIFFKEKATAKKVIGILIGLAGALLCIFTQKQGETAPNPMLGNLYCLLDSVIYAGFLVVSARLLKGIDKVTVSKWTFTGGAVSSLVVVLIAGWYAPVLEQGLFSAPMLVLLFVLVFPSCVSYYLMDIGLKTLSPTVVALYGYLILIVATVASYILGQAEFEWLQLVAMLLIVSSVYFVEVAEKK
ncbi:MAG: EamA family transporter [Muribaculaceae bacterium]|nr:EamA family transporter [Muribaculaceae bacterium]